MAWGEGKAKIIQKAVETPVNDNVPATYLQNHPNALFLDEAAALHSPGQDALIVDECKWDKQLIKKRSFGYQPN